MAPKKKVRAGVAPPPQPEPLRENLGEALNEIHHLIEVAPDEETEAKLREQRRIYFALWEAVLKQKIDQTTPAYLEALKSLRAATTAAQEAKMNIEKLAAAIKKTGAAARLVDKIVQIGIKSLT